MTVATAARSGHQAEAIRRATLKGLRARDAYAEQTAARLLDSLARAEKQVATAILRYKSLGSLPAGKLPALRGLEKLRADIREVADKLLRRNKEIFEKATTESFKLGIRHGIDVLATARLPFYRDLTPGGLDKLATRMFTLIDKDALDFMTEYNLVLAGDVSRELRDGIQRVIMSGIAAGKGTDDLVRDLGHVVKDKETFKHAGSKTFSKAQYRMALIARTEILRAHNQGAIKFYSQVGIEKMEWMTMEDERVCPVCGPLDGKIYPIDKLPALPAHPACRCGQLPVLSIENAPRKR